MASQIIDFSLFGDVPGFSMLGAIAKFAKIIYNIVRGTLSWNVKLHLKTESIPLLTTFTQTLSSLVLYSAQLS